MGLTTEVQEMKSEYKQAQIEAKKATKKAEEIEKKLNQTREEKKTQRQYEKDLTKAVENDCIGTMKRCFERDGCKKGLLNLSLSETRNEIIKNVPENEFERNYLDKHYESILNRVAKIYKNDLKAKEELQKEVEAKQLAEELKKIEQQKEIEEEKHKRQNIIIGIFNLIGNMLKWVFIILFGGIYFIFKVISGMAKGS